MRGSEAVVKLLKDVGVEVIFRLCGDTSLPFYDALASGDHGIRHVLTRDERSASFMADAYARLSGKVGVCEGPAPSHDAVTAAAERLVNARRPLLVAGAGVLRSGAWGEVTVLAELLGMPVATSIGGKGSIAEIHPYSLGVIGSNGGLRFRHDMLRESDVILYVGSRQGSVTTEKWTLPADGEKTLIQMDVEPVRIGHNYETAVGIVADAKLGLAAVTEEVADRLGGRPAEKIQVNEIGRRRAAYMASIDEFRIESHTDPTRTLRGRAVSAVTAQSDHLRGPRNTLSLSVRLLPRAPGRPVVRESTSPWRPWLCLAGGLRRLPRQTRRRPHRGGDG